MKYSYFIAYTGQQKRGSAGFCVGRAEINRDTPIANIDDIREIETLMRKETGLESFTVTNFIRFEPSAPSAKSAVENPEIRES